MRTREDLRHALHRIDGRGYPAYKDIRGAYRFDGFDLLVDHVQGDPYAAPTRLRVRVPRDVARFPAHATGDRSRTIALRDLLARAFSAACRRASGRRGSGKSGMLAMDMPGQEILERSSVVVEGEAIEARFLAGLPAAGRRILGRQAAAMLCDEVPEVVARSLLASAIPGDALRRHLDAAEDADALRARIIELGLVAFVADGSVLPRRSGVDDRPLPDEKAVSFRSPSSLRVEVEVPHAGKIAGMGIRRGVTLIVGGGYHGKSTLLSAIERGVYNHIPGDGRELVVTHPTAVKIRAEDGRRIERVDIHPFIGDLPDGSETTQFSTENASGSTSQAANIIEALEAGARVLLLDEDTCATNLMIRDARMQALVAKSGEPITAFVDRVRQLYETSGVSTILVMGGSGDYFDAADTVLLMDAYVPREVTGQAKAVAAGRPTGRAVEASGPFGPLRRRAPLAASIDPSKGRHEIKVKARGLKTIVFGRHEIDLTAVEQLVDEGQLLAIARALHLARERFMDGRRDVAAVVSAVMEEIRARGLDALDDRRIGAYAAFRPQELAAAMDRLRTLKVRSLPPA